MRRTLTTLAILIFSFTLLHLVSRQGSDVSYGVGARHPSPHGPDAGRGSGEHLPTNCLRHFTVDGALEPNAAYGSDIKKIETIKFEEESELQSIPRSFCVTEDGLFLIPDQHTGYVKIYEKVYKEEKAILKLVKKFGPSGNEGDEFDRPAYCFYDAPTGKFGVIDVRTKIVYVFDRLKQDEFIPARTVRADGYDMTLGGDGKRLVISGYTVHGEDKQTFELYSINLNDPSQRKFFLTSPEKYGLSPSEYQRQYFTERTIPAIGIKAFIDIQNGGDNAFFAYEGKLRVVRINLVSGEKTIFGHKTEHYREPVASKELLNYRSERNYSKTTGVREKMSFVRDIFATQNHIFVVYEGPGKSNFRLQAYTPEGKFLTDIKMPGGTSGQKMWLDKYNYTMYSLSKKGKKETQLVTYKVEICQ